MSKIIIATYLLIAATVIANQDAPETTVNQGALRGKYQQTWKGRKFSAFTGIPYAKPPVGELRFKTAVKAEPWNGVFDASKPHAICPQMDVFFNDFTVKGDEDCLYLNVYTPQLSNFDTKHLPVMLYLHGGGWMLGSANPDLYGPGILLDKDIVLVTANYRLGALGFLSTGDEVVPGNNGLKDQIAALQWLKENIARFGGDPERITVFGQSAGGASAHFLVLSPLSKGLIKGAIAHSGTALASWALAPQHQSLGNSKKLANLLNCPTSSSEKMVECLRKLNSYDIIEQDKYFMEWFYEPMIPFKPSIEPDLEGAFLARDPEDIIKSGDAADVPFMIGFDADDGTIKSAAFYNDSNLIKELDADFNRVAPLIIQYYDTASNKELVGNKIREFYFGNGRIDDSTKAQLTNMVTDSLTLAPQNLAAQLHTKYSDESVYYFVFGYRGSISLGPLFGDPSHDYGVCHGDEINYLLSNDLFPNFKPTEFDQQIIDVLTTLWTNFAAFGNPTPQVDALIRTKWEAVQDGKLSYYFIRNPDDIKMVDNVYKERAEFWNNLSAELKSYKVKDEL